MKPIAHKGSPNDGTRPLDGSSRDGGASDGGGYGAPYAPPGQRAGREEYYEPVPPADYRADRPEAGSTWGLIPMNEN